MKKQDLPAGAGDVAEQYPEIWEAYASLGKACANAGPLDEGQRRLIKLSLAIGTGSEGAVHSHTRRALAEGVTPEALKQVAMLAIPTVGFPAAVAALTWIQDITDAESRDG
ncbi:MAG: carboxymuconolactone decarboxylase family protein [Pseudomonadota bacterium]